MKPKYKKLREIPKQFYRTYYSIPNVNEGDAFFKDFKDIKRWGKERGFKFFMMDRKLFLMKDTEIIVYSRNKFKGQRK